MVLNCLREGNVLTFLHRVLGKLHGIHYANSSIIYSNIFMALTQVMFQVKACEMVCKHGELILSSKRCRC